MFWHSSREKHGLRAWWHFNSKRHRVIGVECSWWSPRFGACLSTDDDGWNLSLRVPPVALYVSLEGFPLWQPTRTTIATWDHDRVIALPDRREAEVSVHDWTIHLTPWGRWGEWRSADPWWIRGLSVDLKQLVLGKQTHHAVELALVPCHVPMPEGQYPAVAKVSRVTRGRTRWLKRTATEVSLDIPKGIPHAGKGENSWDCGDDGLFGIGGSSIDDAIANAQRSVTRDRERYGRSSDEAIREALA